MKVRTLWHFAANHPAWEDCGRMEELSSIERATRELWFTPASPEAYGLGAYRGVLAMASVLWITGPTFCPGLADGIRLGSVKVIALFAVAPTPNVSAQHY